MVITVMWFADGIGLGSVDMSRDAYMYGTTHTPPSNTPLYVCDSPGDIIIATVNRSNTAWRNCMAVGLGWIACL